MSVLGDRLLAVHRRLDEARIPHAFGGAIALAYCTEEPRGTRDVDVNVFVAPDEVDRVFAALPEDVSFDENDVAAVARDGQARLWWSDTPIDLFFSVHAFHLYAAERVRSVPFEGVQIPVLDCMSLVVFKVMFNRTRDWADIEAMLDVDAFDREATLVWVRELLGDGAEARRLAALPRDG